MAALVIVTGGVCSSLGKGICAASLGRLLVDRGLTISLTKLDPYLNGDPGTMAPSEHGECWVTDDGRETDLDAGHYERLTGVATSAANSITAGGVYWTVLQAERRGDYLGHTVQAVPHITGEIRRRLEAVADGVDVAIAEIGGTVGDIEIQVFLEAVRQMRADSDLRICNVHLTLVPAVGPSRELKTKPSQHSVTAMRSHGLNPDVLVARSEHPLPDELRAKLATSCGIRNVISAPDVSSIYAVPGHLAQEGLDRAVLDVLGIDTPDRDSTAWDAAVAALIDPPDNSVRIAVAGKYTDGHDTYLSIGEALRHAGAARGVRVDIDWLDAEQLDGDLSALDNIDGIIVPGGFGSRGVDGKLAASRRAREHDIPYLGICLGMQVAVVDIARHLAGIVDATSAEWADHGSHVIAPLDSQQQIADKGGTMRLGAWDAQLTAGTRTASLYGQPDGGRISERHRHRYEVNPSYVDTLEAAGMTVAAREPSSGLVEHIELADHLFYVATQAHPELRSGPGRPHPLFAGLIDASCRHQARRDRTDTGPTSTTSSDRT